MRKKQREHLTESKYYQHEDQSKRILAAETAQNSLTAINQAITITEEQQEQDTASLPTNNLFLFFMENYWYLILPHLPVIDYRMLMMVNKEVYNTYKNKTDVWKWYYHFYSMRLLSHLIGLEEVSYPIGFNQFIAAYRRICDPFLKNFPYTNYYDANSKNRMLNPFQLLLLIQHSDVDGVRACIETYEKIFPPSKIFLNRLWMGMRQQNSGMSNEQSIALQMAPIIQLLGLPHWQRFRNADASDNELCFTNDLLLYAAIGARSQEIRNILFNAVIAYFIAACIDRQEDTEILHNFLSMRDTANRTILSYAALLCQTDSLALIMSAYQDTKEVQLFLESTLYRYMLILPYEVEEFEYFYPYPINRAVWKNILKQAIQFNRNDIISYLCTHVPTGIDADSMILKSAVTRRKVATVRSMMMLLDAKEQYACLLKRVDRQWGMRGSFFPINLLGIAARHGDLAMVEYLCTIQDNNIGLLKVYVKIAYWLSIMYRREDVAEYLFTNYIAKYAKEPTERISLDAELLSLAKADLAKPIEIFLAQNQDYPVKHKSRLLVHAASNYAWNVIKCILNIPNTQHHLKYIAYQLSIRYQQEDMAEYLFINYVLKYAKEPTERISLDAELLSLAKADLAKPIEFFLAQNQDYLVNHENRLLVHAGSNNAWEVVKCILTHIQNTQSRFKYNGYLMIPDKHGNTILFYAVHHRKWLIIQTLLELGAQPIISGTKPFICYLTEVFCAACRSSQATTEPLSLSLFEVLLRQYPHEFNHQSDMNNRETPLMVAINHDCYEVAKAIIKTPGIDLELKCAGGETALAKAYKSKSRYIIACLLEHGATYDCRSPLIPILICPAESDPTRFKKIIGIICKINPDYFHNLTEPECILLSTSVIRKNNLTLLESLLSNPASAEIIKRPKNLQKRVFSLLDSSGVSADIMACLIEHTLMVLPTKEDALLLFHKAIQDKSLRLIKVLLEKEGHLLCNDGQDDSHPTLLMYAIKCLEPLSSTMHEGNNFNRDYASVFTGDSSLEAELAIIKHIANFPSINLEATDGYGETALSLALYHQVRTEIIKYLVEIGAQLPSENKMQLFMGHAAKKGRLDIVQYIYGKNISVNYRLPRPPSRPIDTLQFFGETQNAYEQWIPNEAKWLKKWQSRPNYTDLLGKTPLQLAYEGGYPRVVAYLLKMGAENVIGKVLMHWAAKKGSLEIIDILCKRCETKEELWNLIDALNIENQTPLMVALNKSPHADVVEYLMAQYIDLSPSPNSEILASCVGGRSLEIYIKLLQPSYKPSLSQTFFTSPRPLPKEKLKTDLQARQHYSLGKFH
jgi:ankyrin repeat protein